MNNFRKTIKELVSSRTWKVYYNAEFLILAVLGTLRQTIFRSDRWDKGGGKLVKVGMNDWRPRREEIAPSVGEERESNVFNYS